MDFLLAYLFVLTNLDFPLRDSVETRERTMPPPVVTLFRVKNFLKTMTGALWRPLPSKLHLVNSEEEARRDLKRDGKAQLTRPDPSRQQLRSFLECNILWLGGLCGAMLGLLTKRLRRRGTSEQKILAANCVAAVPAAAAATVVVIVGRVLQRVWWLRDQLDYRVMPRLNPTFESDAALLAEAWATPTGKIYDVVQFSQPRGGYCGFAAIAAMFRSCPGAEQLWIQYPR